MKRLLLAACLLFGALPLQAQQGMFRTPDCVITFRFTAAGSAGGPGGGFFDNRGKACTRFVLSYQSTGFSAVSIQADEAPLSTTVDAVGTWVVWPSNQIYGSGTLPLTTTTVNSIGVFGYHPFIRVTLNSKTGTGVIYGTLLGWAITDGDPNTGGGIPVVVSAPVATPAFVTITPSATGGWSSVNATAADGATACTNTAQVIKASAGTFGGYFINNPNVIDEWVQIYNVVAASVTVGTTNPQLTFRIPGNSSFAAAANSVGANIEFANGINFATAMSFACTSTAAGAGAPGNSLEAILLYK